MKYRSRRLRRTARSTAAAAATASAAFSASADGVVEFRIGQAHIPFAVQSDAVKLHLHEVVAVARDVEHDAGGLIDFNDIARFEGRVVGKGRELLATKIVEIEVTPAVALRFPDEPSIILQILHGGAVVSPTGQPLLMHDHPARAVGRAASNELHDLLAAIATVQEKLGAVGRPAHIVGIMPDHVIGERLPVPDVHLHGLSRGSVVDEDIGDRIRRARFRVSLDIHGVLHRRLVHLQVEVFYLTLVEAIVSDLRAIGRPPDRGGLGKFLAINPATGPVLNATLLAAVRTDGLFARSVKIGDPQIAIAVKGLQLMVGRFDAERLPAARCGASRAALHRGGRHLRLLLLHTAAAAARRLALRLLSLTAASSATPAAPARIAGRLRRVAGHRSFAGGCIVFVRFPAEIVSKALAVARPSHAQGSGCDGAVDLGLHLGELIVPRHLLDAILRQHNGGAGNPEQCCCDECAHGHFGIIAAGQRQNFRISHQGLLRCSVSALWSRTGTFMCRFANLRQVDWRRRGSPFAEASAPGGSRNGSTEMRS